MIYVIAPDRGAALDFVERRGEMVTDKFRFITRTHECQGIILDPDDKVVSIGLDIDHEDGLFFELTCHLNRSIPIQPALW